jgi:hypothetical protein
MTGAYLKSREAGPVSGRQAGRRASSSWTGNVLRVGGIFDQAAVELGDDLLAHLFAEPRLGVGDRDVKHHVVELAHLGQEIGDGGGGVGPAEARVKTIALDLAGCLVLVGADAEGQRHRGRLYQDLLALAVGAGEAQEDHLAALAVLLQRGELDGHGRERGGEHGLRHGCLGAVA